MSQISTALRKLALLGLRGSGLDRLMARHWRGVGLIYMLHHVKPETPRGFAPNRILQITPDFLEAVILQAQEAGLAFVSLDEMHRRLVSGDFSQPFVCFTLDDGYRDNAEYAYPVFRKHDVPFTIYVTTDFADGRGELWWLALEEAIKRVTRLRLTIPGLPADLPCATEAEKWRAYRQIYWPLRAMAPRKQRAVVREIAEMAGVDMTALCRQEAMTWTEIKELARDPLVTIGAHTRAHFALAKLDEAEAKAEMQESLDRLAKELGRRPDHFAYPYGDADSAGPREFALAKEMGIKTAVTTRKGMLFPAHKEHMTALPRVSLNGDYQRLTYTATYLTGAPFALWNRFRSLDVT